MDLVLRAIIIYAFLLLAVRISGKRTLGEMTMFDFVLVLVIAEATDNSIVGEDHALISTIVVITTLVAVNLLVAFLKQKSQFVEKVLESTPVIVLENGKIRKDVADKERIDESDIMEEARKLQGVERLEQIKYAVLEKSGEITIIPRKS